MKLEVIKDCYCVFNGHDLEDEYLTTEDLFNNITHLLMVGDIWETDIDNSEDFICIKSEHWLNDSNDGWWEYKWVKDFFKVIE